MICKSGFQYSVYNFIVQSKENYEGPMLMNHHAHNEIFNRNLIINHLLCNKHTHTHTHAILLNL